MQREQLIDLINSNGGFVGQELPYNCPFDELELAGILEYGNPGAFPRQEYTDNVVFNTDSTRRLYDEVLDYTPIQRDYIDAKKLGLSMSILKRSLCDRRRDTRRKNILVVLDGLPEKFRALVNPIKSEHLDRLAEFCIDYSKSDAQRIAILYITHRANNTGIYVSRDELPRHFDIKVKGLKLLSDLRGSGLLEERVVNSVEVQANNILFDFRNRGHLTGRQLMFAQTRVSEFKERYPGVLTGKKNLGVVVALMSIRLTRDVKLIQILSEHAEIYELDKVIRRENYLSVRRAEDRSEVYMSELNDFHSDFSIK